MSDNTIKRYGQGYIEVGYDGDEKPVVVQSPMCAIHDGDWVLYSDHIAALSRAREDARREALEEVRSALEAARQMHGGVFALDVMAAIAPTPQGETKEKP